MFTVWFRNESLPPDEEDYEWPACFIISAANERKAQEWGGHLANRFSRSHPNERLLRVKVEPIEKYSTESLASVPRIEHGYEATDDEIGW